MDNTTQKIPKGSKQRNNSAKKADRQLVVELLNLYDQEVKTELEKTHNKTKGSLSNCNNVIYSILSKSTKTTRAILHLADLGYVEDGYVLLRGLLEGLINTKFILRDQQIYPKMFLDYGFYDWFRKIENLAEDNTHLNFTKQCKDLLTKANRLKYKQIKQCRGRIKGTDYNWSKKSLRKMAEICHLKNPYYDRVYFYLSQYTHVHPSGLRSYSSRSNGATIFDDSPNLKGAEELLITTLDLYSQQIALLIDYAEVKNNSVNKIKNDLEKLKRELNKNDKTT